MPHDRWLDDDAGPLVRPYAIVQGRTESASDRFDLITIVSSVPSLYLQTDLEFEHQKVLTHCKGAISVVDLAYEVRLPIGVVRVLLGDLLDLKLISIRQPGPANNQRHNRHTLKEVLDGLRAL
jgi:hypothetical protein